MTTLKRTAFLQLSILAAALSLTPIHIQAAIQNPTASAVHTNFVDTSPFSLVTGDINGDGYLDAISINNTANTVTIMTNDFSGQLVTVATNAVGASPRGALLKDINGSGHLDLLVASESNSSVSILYGVGDGTFSGPVELAANSGTYAVAAGPLDDDVLDDLAVANKANGSVYLYRGQEAGGFEFVKAMVVGVDPSAIKLWDFNMDGILDMVTAHQGYDLRVRLGLGDFDFDEPQVHPLPSNYVVIADMNDDGIMDLITVGAEANVLLGSSDGSFSLVAGPSVNSIAGGYQFAVADFNGDGRNDVVVASLSFKTVSVLLGQGDGTLVDPLVWNVDQRARMVVAADMNKDGRADLLVGSYAFPATSTVTWFANTTLPSLEITPMPGAVELGWWVPYATDFLLQAGQFDKGSIRWDTEGIATTIVENRATAIVPMAAPVRLFRLIK